MLAKGEVEFECVTQKPLGEDLGPLNAKELEQLVSIILFVCFFLIFFFLVNGFNHNTSQIDYFHTLIGEFTLYFPLT